MAIKEGSTGMRRPLHLHQIIRRGLFRRDTVFRYFLAGFLIDDFHTQLYFSSVVDSKHFHFDTVAFVNDVGYLADPFLCQFTDVAK